MDRDKTKPSRDTALVTNPGTSAKTTCDHCGKSGHPESRCWKKYPHLRPNPNRGGRKQTGLAAHSSCQSATETDDDNENEVCLMAKTDSNVCTHQQDWIIDSGCSTHICYDRDRFSEIKTCEPFSINIGDESSVKAVGRGTIRLVASVNGKPRNAVVKNVAYAPDMAYNMLSVREMTRGGKRAIFDEHSVVVEKDGKVV